MDQWLESLRQIDSAYILMTRAVLRYAIPVLVMILLIRCLRPLLTFRREPEIWAWLCLPGGRKLPITHWESVIGRSKSSDVVIDLPTISKTHAVLTRYDDGSWTVSNAGSKNGVLVNGRKISICAVEPDDIITIGTQEMMLKPISRKQEIKLSQIRTKAGSALGSVFNTLLLSVIQMMICFAYVINCSDGNQLNIFLGFLGILITQWLLLIFYLAIRKPSFELETIAFFLCTIGMVAVSAVKPDETLKQMIAMVIGVALFVSLGWSLRDLERAKRIRYAAGVLGILLLLVTLVFGTEYHGAKNWLMIAGISIQPSELSKVCFVLVGASTMARIVSRRNVILFIVYTVTVCGLLTLMNDFGTAMIFFVAFLMIAYLRSGSMGTIALSCTAVGYAGVLAVEIAPHALRRFTNWRHIWENALTTGYQQTRALMCIASGGLFGLGAGRGWMHHVFAADSDIVFATICEEWGLLIGIMLIVCVIGIALFALRATAVGRSSFYTICACTAAGILMIQAILNALGTVDILPLTGVTFPFVSNGGSSMICAWGLLAFVKAADTRQNASFAVRQSKEGLPDE